MPQSKKKSVTKPPDKTPVTETRGSSPLGRWTLLIIIAVFIGIIGLVVWITSYFSEDQSYYRLEVIEVDDLSIRMDYFIKRINITGEDPMSMLDTIYKELLIKIEAPKYVGELTEADIDRGLKLAASGGSGNITDIEFKEWKRQQLNQTSFSEDELRDYIGTTILASRLQEYLADRVSTVGEQVYLNAILLNTYEEAEEARARWENGEDFNDLSSELSIDTWLIENRGEVGWTPRGIDELIDFVVFDLDIGEVSQPTSYTGTEDFYLFMVTEKESARAIEEEDMEILRSSALEDWLIVIGKEHDVKFHGRNNGFDSATYYWVLSETSK
jgi:foldase protein PrsA